LRVLISEAKERIGTEPGLNTLQARVDINADSTRLLQQNLEIEQLKAQLNRLMGRAPETPFTVVPPEPTVKAYSYDRLRATLESRNTDLLQAANRYREAQARLRQAESLNYPSLGLFTNLNYNRQQAQVGILSQSQSFGPQVGLTASWVLYDGRTLKRREAQARLNTTVAEWSQADLRLQAATELHQAYDRYQTAAAIIAVETQNIELLAQTAEAALAQFRIGVLNDLELRQTQLKVVDARGRLVQAQLTQRLAEIELNRLCGEFGYGS
jgi:outer membrane protein TolC